MDISIQWQPRGCCCYHLCIGAQASGNHGDAVVITFALVPKSVATTGMLLLSPLHWCPSQWQPRGCCCYHLCIGAQASGNHGDAVVITFALVPKSVATTGMLLLSPLHWCPSQWQPRGCCCYHLCIGAQVSGNHGDAVVITFALVPKPVATTGMLLLSPLHWCPSQWQPRGCCCYHLCIGAQVSGNHRDAVVITFALVPKPVATTGMLLLSPLHWCPSQWQPLGFWLKIFM